MKIETNNLPVMMLVRFLAESPEEENEIKKLDRALKGSSAIHTIAEVDGKKSMSFFFKHQDEKKKNKEKATSKVTATRK